MKVVLKTDIKSLGRKGEIVEVSDGYATSALLPSGKAILATPGLIKKESAKKQKNTQQEKNEKKEAQENAKKLRSAHVTISAKTNGHKLFGALNVEEIAKKLQSTYNIYVEASDIESQPIKEVGEKKVRVHLGHGTHVEITVSVVSL